MPADAISVPYFAPPGLDDLVPADRWPTPVSAEIMNIMIKRVNDLYTEVYKGDPAALNDQARRTAMLTPELPTLPQGTYGPSVSAEAIPQEHRLAFQKHLIQSMRELERTREDHAEAAFERILIKSVSDASRRMARPGETANELWDQAEGAIRAALNDTSRERVSAIVARAKTLVESWVPATPPSDTVIRQVDLNTDPLMANSCVPVGLWFLCITIIEQPHTAIRPTDPHAFFLVNEALLKLPTQGHAYELTPFVHSYSKRAEGPAGAAYMHAFIRHVVQASLEMANDHVRQAVLCAAHEHYPRLFVDSIVNMSAEDAVITFSGILVLLTRYTCVHSAQADNPDQIRSKFDAHLLHDVCVGLLQAPPFAVINYRFQQVKDSNDPQDRVAFVRFFLPYLAWSVTQALLSHLTALHLHICQVETEDGSKLGQESAGGFDRMTMLGLLTAKNATNRYRYFIDEWQMAYPPGPKAQEFSDRCCIWFNDAYPYRWGQNAAFDFAIRDAFPLAANRVKALVSSHLWGLPDPLLDGLCKAIATEFTVIGLQHGDVLWWDSVVETADSLIALSRMPQFIYEPFDLICSVLLALGRIWRELTDHFKGRPYDAGDGWLSMRLICRADAMFTNLWYGRRHLLLQPFIGNLESTDLLDAVQLALFSFSSLKDISIFDRMESAPADEHSQRTIELSIVCYMVTLRTLVDPIRKQRGLKEAMSNMVPLLIGTKGFMERLHSDLQSSEMVDRNLRDLTILFLQAIHSRPGLLAGARRGTMVCLFQAMERQSRIGTPMWGWPIWTVLSAAMREAYVGDNNELIYSLGPYILNVHGDLPRSLNLISHAVRGVIYAAKEPLIDVGFATHMASDAADFTFRLTESFHTHTMDDLRVGAKMVWSIAMFSLEAMDPIVDNQALRMQYNTLSLAWHLLGEVLGLVSVQADQPNSPSNPVNPQAHPNEMQRLWRVILFKPLSNWRLEAE
ncbi:hypothetical protein OF83DRAFT_1177742 [Amylostereum chailletii]|nr:hypothetical protein OF83DRAFT_1177742 [Amylostereum chailletii]